MLPQSGFRQIDIPLDAAQDFIADYALIAKLENRPAFLQESFVRQAFIFGRKEPEGRSGALRFGAFYLADVVFIFDAQALQSIGLCGVTFCDLI